jgi:hypothetical protein
MLLANRDYPIRSARLSGVAMHTEGNDIRTYLARLTRKPMWIAGISACVLAASGVAIVRSIPSSYASISDEGAPLEHRAAASASEDGSTGDLKAQVAVAPAAIRSRKRTLCPECGFIESIARIERSHEGGVKAAGGLSGGASGEGIAARPLTEASYEITVRFHDGSTTVFNDTAQRTWRTGNPVVVIGRTNTSNDRHQRRHSPADESIGLSRISARE